MSSEDSDCQKRGWRSGSCGYTATITSVSFAELAKSLRLEAWKPKRKRRRACYFPAVVAVAVASLPAPATMRPELRRSGGLSRLAIVVFCSLNNQHHYRNKSFCCVLFRQRAYQTKNGATFRTQRYRIPRHVVNPDRF